MNTPAQVIHPKELLIIQIQKPNLDDVPWVIQSLHAFLRNLFDISTVAHKKRHVLQNQNKGPYFTIPEMYVALDPLVEDTFEKMFAVILKHLDTLPDTWKLPEVRFLLIYRRS